MKVYNAIVYSCAVFWLPVYFYRTAGEPMEEEPALWSAKSPPIFPVCDIIVYPLTPTPAPSDTSAAWVARFDGT